ncbi:MAG: EamA family transporter [Rhodospirillaceae bacterium]|nr:EamA family transporter [Rhodospirillaceae bacterium]
MAINNPSNHIGIVLMVGSVILISCSDVIAKLLAHDLAIMQLSLIQGIVILISVPCIARTTRISAIVRTAHPKIQAVRSFCIFVSSVTFYTGLKYLELADVVAIIFIGPLIITALSAVILKEKAGPRRWIACVVGFIGALVVIRPGMSDFGWEVIFPLSATTFYAIYVICTRKIAQRESHATLMFYSAILGVVVLSFSAPFYWIDPNPWSWAGLLTVGILSGTSAALAICAYARAPASLLAPYAYVEILTATLFGFLVFNDLPDYYTVLGATIIVASGLYIFRQDFRDGNSGN